jgi:hypothetical protein
MAACIKYIVDNSNELERDQIVATKTVAGRPCRIMRWAMPTASAATSAGVDTVQYRVLATQSTCRPPRDLLVPS